MNSPLPPHAMHAMPRWHNPDDDVMPFETSNSKPDETDGRSETACDFLPAAETDGRAGAGAGAYPILPVGRPSYSIYPGHRRCRRRRRRRCCTIRAPVRPSVVHECHATISPLSLSVMHVRVRLRRDCMYVQGHRVIFIFLFCATGTERASPPPTLTQGS